MTNCERNLGTEVECRRIWEGTNGAGNWNGGGIWEWDCSELPLITATFGWLHFRVEYKGGHISGVRT